MKAIILSLACVASLPAQTLAPAFLLQEGQGARVWIEAASEKTVRYRANPQNQNRTDVALRKVSIKFFTPPEYKQALDLFEGKDYEKAQPAFAAVREKYKFTEVIPGNFATLAGYFELECSRKLGKYEELEANGAKFKADALLRKTYKAQLELNAIYKSIQAEDWEGLQALCAQWEDRKVTGSQRAQIEYAKGLAFRGMAKTEEALDALNKAMVADFAASEVLVRKAALACFKIYADHPEVQAASKLHGTPDEEPNSPGAILLSEAAALVEMWNVALGRGEKLPDDYKMFSKYKKA